MDPYSHLSKLNNQSKNFTLNHWLFHETNPGFFFNYYFNFQNPKFTVINKIREPPNIGKRLKTLKEVPLLYVHTMHVE
jgi:hypothetical protein